MKKYVYVDYENMSNLNSLPKINGKYFFFVGSSQKNLPTQLVTATSGQNVEWVRIEGNGKNALDFHIAYFLAKNDSESDTAHYVLSKDAGYDPLIAYINKHSVSKAKRIISLDDIAESDNGVKKCDSDDEKAKYDKVLNNISGKRKGRPKSERTLKSYILSQDKTCSESDAQNIIDDLYRNGVISKGTNNRISYSK